MNECTRRLPINVVAICRVSRPAVPAGLGTPTYGLRDQSFPTRRPAGAGLWVGYPCIYLGVRKGSLTPPNDFHPQACGLRVPPESGLLIMNEGTRREIWLD